MAQNLQQTLTDFTNRLNAQNRFSAEYVAEVNKCLNEILELLQNLVQRYNDCQKRLLESSQQFERDSISSEGSSDTQKTADASDAVDDAIEKIDEVKRNPNPDDDVLNDLRNTLIGTQRRLMDAVAEINELRQQLAQQQQIIATTFAN